MLKEAIYYRIGSIILGWIVTYLIIGSYVTTFILSGILFVTHTIYYMTFQTLRRKHIILVSSNEDHK